MRFGIQMFGMGRSWKRDKQGFYQRLRELGVQGVEPCVLFDGEPPEQLPGIWSPKVMEEEKKRLDACGLRIPSLHAFFDDVDAALPAMVRMAREWGVNQFVVKSPNPASREACRKFVQRSARLAEALRSAGAELLVHNEEDDIRTQLDGKTALEWELDEARGALSAQVDMGWALAGGVDVEAFLWRNADRVRSLHYKDFALSPDDAKEVPLGEGTLDITAGFQFGRAQGLWHILDSDMQTENQLEQLEQTMERMKALTGVRDHTSSILATLDAETGEIRTLHRFDREIIEAPNWLSDGDTLLYNAEGRIWTYSISQDCAQELPVDGCVHCNNDHAPSPDQRSLAVSNDPNGGWMSHIYVKDLRTNEVRRVTENSPSFLHGWSPDGRTLAYCAFRTSQDATQVDVYTIPAEGGPETRLTDGVGYNDGPEYAPDGKTLWYNSTRSGLMQVWRMNADGSDPVQMTHSEANNWFPHVSPDGQSVVYLAFRKDELDPSEHLPNMRVQLRVMNSNGTADRLLCSFFGGQGSINVNSWSPDSRQVAMVLYELHHR